MKQQIYYITALLLASVVGTTDAVGQSVVAKQSATTEQSTAMSRGYAGFLEVVASRSPQLRAAEKGYDAAAKGFRVGLAPSDPEASLEYYFGDETRFELALEQRFDFPTVYHQRNKISKLQISKSSQELLLAKRGIMAEVSDNYLTMTYMSQRDSLLSQRRAELARLVDLYTEGVDRGQIGAVEMQSATMMLVGIDTELASVRASKVAASNALLQLSGGRDIAPAGYPVFDFSGSSADFVAAALESDYALRAAALDTLIAGRMLKLSRNEWIPQIKIGYKLEMAGTQPANALLAGISLPLWQNSGKVRHAKAVGEAARAGAAATESAARARLESLFASHESLRTALLSLKASGSSSASGDYAELLKKALDGGKLSSINYLLALSEWYSTQDRRLQLEYETAQFGATMTLCLI